MKLAMYMLEVYLPTLYLTGERASYQTSRSAWVVLNI